MARPKLAHAAGRTGHAIDAAGHGSYDAADPGFADGFGASSPSFLPQRLSPCFSLWRWTLPPAAFLLLMPSWRHRSFRFAFFSALTALALRSRAAAAAARLRALLLRFGWASGSVVSAGGGGAGFLRFFFGGLPLPCVRCPGPRGGSAAAAGAGGCCARRRASHAASAWRRDLVLLGLVGVVVEGSPFFAHHAPQGSCASCLE